MRKGKLTLIDHEEINRLRNSRNAADRYAIVGFNGTFRLPDMATGPARALHRMTTNCGTRGPPKIHPTFLRALFDEASPAADEDHQLIIDIRRAVSACGDEATWNATTAWAQDNYGRDRATKFGRQTSMSSQGTHEETLVSDAQKALEEYLPHRSKWTRLLDPTAGYQALIDRFAHGEVVFADGSRYRGEMKNGRPDGVGILYCPRCNLTHNGYWKAGNPHGYGAMTVGESGSPERTEYYGNFRHGLRDGKGIQLVRGGKVILKGEFKDDVLHGPHCSVDIADDIVQTMSSGYKRYVGGMENGMLGGKGKFDWADGVSYKGHFTEGLRHRQGSVRDKDNKTVVAGEWSKDFPNGRISTLVLADGKVYTGDVKNGQRQGMGEVFHKGVATYEGLWMNDLPNGRGTLYTADGIYEGEFRGGKRHGKGRFEFKVRPQANGKPRVYEGDWKNDKPDGTGRYVNEIGVENAYKFKEGELIPSSVKAYKAGLCGKAPTVGGKFQVQRAPITSHDPKYWGLKRKMNPEEARALHALGCKVWPQHINKDFVFMDPSTTETAFQTGEDRAIPKPPVKQKSMQSIDSAENNRDLLQILIENADNLVAPSSRKLHPYCRVRLGRIMKRTKPINAAGPNPRWASMLHFPKAGGWAEFEVWDKDPIGPDQFVGSAELNVHEFLMNGTERVVAALPLTRYQNKEGVEAGVLHVTLQLANKFLVGSTDGAATESHVAPMTPTATDARCSIQIRGFKDLYTKEVDGKMDPYFVFYLGQTRVQTDPIENGTTTSAAALDVVRTLPYNNEPSLRVEVWDKDAFGNDDFVGSSLVRLASFTSGEVEIYRLDKDQQKDVPAGKIDLAVTLAMALQPLQLSTSSS